MAQITQKMQTIKKALKTLHKSVEQFNKYEEQYKKNTTENNEELFLMSRDSMIQRFEYCTDLFWKVLKIYLEEIEKIKLETYSPKGVIRASVTAGIFSEDKGTACITMVTERNRTSHIYHEKIADDIAHSVPKFYQLLMKIVQHIQKNIP